MIVSPAEGLRALQVTLTLAEHFQAWDLLKATLAYVQEAGGTVLHTGPYEWFIQVAEEDFNDTSGEPSRGA